MKRIECPVCNAEFDCPYFGADGFCELHNPAIECDDYSAVYGEDEEEEDRYTLADLGSNWW